MPVLAAAAVLVTLATAQASPTRVGAEPRAYQLWTSGPPPKQGRVFGGATLMLLRQAAVTLRPESARFSCQRGAIMTSKRRLVAYAPVETIRIRPQGDDGGPVIAVWTCIWRLPPRSGGMQLNAGYTFSAVAVDPVTGEEGGRTVEGGALSWRIVQ